MAVTEASPDVAHDEPGQTLDDLMIAMDVVDTLRHRADLVERELDAEEREAELIERLRRIYHEQGIEVPDHVLREGVAALKESRFVYTPPPEGWKRTLLTAWVRRGVLGRRIAIAAGAIGAAALGYYLLEVRPARLAEERARIELNETLPKGLRQAHASVMAVATDPAAKTRADTLLADGERAVARRDRAAAAKAQAALATLADDLAREYTLTVVSRPGEPSGVWRRPPGRSNARNYYLIVEAVTSRGERLKLPVRDEETGRMQEVSRFGVRVSQDVYEAVRRDKADNGIVEDTIVGIKPRGTLTIDFRMPSAGGFITRW